MTTDGFDELDAKLEALANIADVIEHDVAPKVNEVMRNYAIEMVTRVRGAASTGALRNSIQGVNQIVIREDDTTVEMGISATSDHLNYVEFGTGIHGSATYTDVEGGTHTAEGVTFKPKAMWYQHNPEYQGDFGKNNDPRKTISFGGKESEENPLYREWIPRYSQHPRPIMRPALYDNIGVIEDIMSEAIGEVFDD